MNKSSGAQRHSRTFIWKTPRLNSFILHSLLESMRKEHKRGSETELDHICLFMFMCTFISSLLAFSILSADPGPTCCCPLLENTRRYRLQTWDWARLWWPLTPPGLRTSVAGSHDSRLFFSWVNSCWSASVEGFLGSTVSALISLSNIGSFLISVNL